MPEKYCEKNFKHSMFVKSVEIVIVGTKIKWLKSIQNCDKKLLDTSSL